MKVLSMNDRRLQDRLDAHRLLQIAENLDLDDVREDLRLITLGASIAARIWTRSSRRS